MAYGGFIWTPPRNSGGIPKASTRFSLSMEMSRLPRNGTAEPVSRDQILRHARGQGNVHFPYSADHEQDWQPYPVDPYSATCDDHTYIRTYFNKFSSSLQCYIPGILLLLSTPTFFLVPIRNPQLAIIFFSFLPYTSLHSA